MSDAAKSLYDSTRSYADIERLVQEGEAESLFLECKAPEQPILSRDLQMTLSIAISGFSNTNGGVIIWGISTTKKAKNDLDILTQVEPLANCSRFATEISNKIPTLSIPSIVNFENKIVKKRKSDTRGIVLTYIPAKMSDPVQSIKDEKFYFRSGDDFVVAPYQMLKRLFAASENPDISVIIPEGIVKKESEEFWDIPISIANHSSAVGKYIKLSITVVNPVACSEIKSDGLTDISNINPGRKIYSAEMVGVLHRGFNTVLGRLKIKMAGNKSKVEIKIQIFADKMRAKEQLFSLKLFKNKFTTKVIRQSYLY